MARYLMTLRGQHAKTHIVTGHSDHYLTNCGLRYNRQTNLVKRAKLVRIPPIGRRSKGTIWPDIKTLDVTCDHCLRNPKYLPFLQKEE